MRSVQIPKSPLRNPMAYATKKVDLICEFCGNVGFAKELAPCNRCKVFYRHSYCMRYRSIKIGEVWHCEECGREPVDGEADTSKRKKMAVLSGKSNSAPKCGKKPEYSGSSSERKMQPLSEGNQIRDAEAPKALCFPSDNDTILNTEVKSIASGHPRSSLAQAIPTSPDTNMVLSRKKQRPAGSDVHCSLGEYITRSTKVGNKENETPRKAENSGYSMTHQQEFLDRFSPDASWKGSFRIFEVDCHLYKQMRAHLPLVTCPKVYDSLKSLPEELSFVLCPRDRVWPKIFQLVPPTNNDIGMYFFPCESERSKKKYLRLLEWLRSCNMAMKARINDIELLLFTSDDLPGCSRGMDVETCMWGVFRHVKRKKHSRKIEVHSGLNKSQKLPVPSECKTEEGETYIGRADASILKVCHPLTTVHDQHRVYEESSSKCANNSSLLTFKGFTYSRRKHLLHCSQESIARDSKCAKTSETEFFLEKKAGTILPEILPDFPEPGPVNNFVLQASQQVKKSNESLTRNFTPSDTKIPVQRECISNGSRVDDTGNVDCRKRPLVKFFLKNSSTLDSVVRACFLKHGPSGSLETSTTKHHTLSSAEIGGHIASPDPKTPEMQLKHHKEKYTAGDLFCSTNSYVNVSLASKDLPAEKKVYGSSENISVNKSLRPREGGENESSSYARHNLVDENDQGNIEAKSQSMVNQVQNSKMTVPCEKTPDEYKESKRRERGANKNVTFADEVSNNALSLAQPANDGLKGEKRKRPDGKVTEVVTGTVFSRLVCNIYGTPSSHMAI